jgi:hypothetical protein
MTSWPELHELIWLFESEPTVEYEDLGWPVSAAMFETSRDAWMIRCTIRVYDYSVEIQCSHDDGSSVAMSLRSVVEAIEVDRSSGSESLLIRSSAASGLAPVPALTVKLDDTYRAAAERSV